MQIMLHATRRSLVHVGFGLIPRFGLDRTGRVGLFSEPEKLAISGLQCREMKQKDDTK